MGLISLILRCAAIAWFALQDALSCLRRTNAPLDFAASPRFACACMCRESQSCEGTVPSAARVTSGPGPCSSTTPALPLLLARKHTAAMQRVRSLFAGTSSSGSNATNAQQHQHASMQQLPPTPTAAAAQHDVGGMNAAGSNPTSAGAAAAQLHRESSSSARSSRHSKSSRGGAGGFTTNAHPATHHAAAAAASYAASSQPHAANSVAPVSSSIVGRSTPAGLRSPTPAGLLASSNASVASSDGGGSVLAAGMHALEFSNPLQTHDEDVNLYLMAEWARSNKRAKQRHAGPYLVPAHGTHPHSSLHPSHNASSHHSQHSVISSAQSSSESVTRYSYSPPSHSRSLAPSMQAASQSAASKGQPMHAAAAPSVRGQLATAHAPAASLPSSPHSQPSSPSGSSIQRKRGRPVEIPAALSAVEALPLVAAAAAAPSTSFDASLLPLSRSRMATDDMLSDSGESEQIEPQFHPEDFSSPSNAGSPALSPHTAAMQPLQAAAPAIAPMAAAAASTAAAVAPAASSLPRSALDALQFQLPLALPLVLSFVALRTKALVMQVCRQWQSIVLTEPTCWEGSHWHPMVPLSAATHASFAAAASVASTLSSQGGGFGGVRDACGVFTRLNLTYGVGAEHARWIVPPVPPHSFLLSRLRLLDLKRPDTLSSGTRGAANIWTDAHLVLLPYFSSLTALDLSYMGASDPNNTGNSEGLNSTGSSTLSALARPAARLTGVVLGRVALLPCLQRLVLDHCGEWVDDEALACLRNKYNCRLAITPGETPPTSEEYANAAAAAASAAAAPGAAAAPSKSFLPPITTLPSLTHLSLEFCTRITAAGLAYLVGSGGVPSLRELNLSNCARAVSALSMQALADTNHSTLRVLDLSWCGGIGKLAATKVTSATLLPLASMGGLTRLDLRGWGELQAETLELLCVSAAGGAGLAASISNFLAPRMPLVSLNLRGCSNLGAKGLTQIGRLSSTLVELDLSDCRVVCDATLRVLGYSLHKLERLVLWTCNEVTDRGIEALLCGGQALQACWKLQRALHARAVDALGAEAAASADLPRSIAGGSCLLHSLRSLKLSSASRLTDSICTVLCHCTRLGELELMDLPQLSDAGLRALCATVAHHHGIASGALQRTLHTLHLSRGGPGLTSACGASLRALSGLTNLDVSWNERVGDEMLAHVLLPTPFAFTASPTTKHAAGSAPSSTSHPRLPNLRKLNVARCAITHRGLQLLVERAPSLSELDVRYCPSLNLSHLEFFRRSLPGASVEHTCSTLADEEEDESAAACATTVAAPMQEEEEADPPSPLELERAAPVQVVAPPLPATHWAPPHISVSVTAPPAAAAATLPLAIVSPCSLTQSSSSGSSPPRMRLLSHVAVPLAAVSSQARAAAALQLHLDSSSESESGRDDRGAAAGRGVAVGMSACSGSDSGGGGDGFRVECQVVENEDGEDEEEEGDDAEDDEDDDEEDEDDDDSRSNDSMRSLSDAAALPTFVQEEDEQGEVWAVHQ